MISIINYKKISLNIIALFFTLIPYYSYSENVTHGEDKKVIEGKFEKSFQAMMQDPSNVDITLEYASLAVQLNNYEAAVPPLERILIFNPKLSKIKYELGVLYFNLNSMVMAKAYLEDAIKDKDLTDEIKTKATEYLQKIKG